MKGLNALELIFTMFVLIIVVFVIVRMFIQQMRLEEIQKPLEQWKEVNMYQQAKSECEIYCEAFRNNPGDLNVIKDYCTHKAKVDLDGDGKTYENLRPGQLAQGRVVAEVPYCEDGIYCFHIYECSYGSIVLDAETCLRYLCNYYTTMVGYDPDIAMAAVKKVVHWGTCDPNKVYTVLNGVKITPSWWWEKAGYNSPDCEHITPGGGEEEGPPSPPGG